MMPFEYRFTILFVIQYSISMVNNCSRQRGTKDIFYLECINKSRNYHSVFKSPIE